MTAIVIGGGNVGYEVAARRLADEPVVVVDKRYPPWLRDMAATTAVRFVERDALGLFDLEAVLEQAVPNRDRTADKLICTVGTYSQVSPLDDPAGFEREFDLNFFANIVPVKALLPGMLQRRAGHIVVLSSTSGHHAPASLTAYGPSKWALEGFCGSLHAETRGTGIAVDAISPTTLANVRSEVFTFSEGIAPARVGEAIERALRGTGAHRRFVPPYYRGVRVVERLAPRLLDRAFRKRSHADVRGDDVRQRSRPRSALITGASSGLGRELAMRYAPELQRLHVVARSREALEDLAREVGRLAPRCEVLVETLDMSDLDAVSRYARGLPPVELLVNNAALHVEAPIVDTPLELYHRLFATNFFAAVRLTSTLLSREQPPRKIVNVCSTTAIAGRRNLSAYASTKAALWCFTRSLRRVLPTSVHVLEVLPATFVSSLFEKGLRPGQAGPARSAETQAMHSRVMTAAQVATCVHQAEARGRRQLFLPVAEATAFLVLEVLAPPVFRRLFH
jgi:NAD(P)-dependent dehydrogenase (short-subunit alcohol dehydrogenase family)